HLLAPPRRSLLGIIGPWNRAHPEHPLALLDVPCGEGRGHCSGRPPSLPPALVSSAQMFPLRGRTGLSSTIAFDVFRTGTLDRGVRRTSFDAHRDRYTRSLDHTFSFQLAGGVPAKVLCRDWMAE